MVVIFDFVEYYGLWIVFVGIGVLVDGGVIVGGIGNVSYCWVWVGFIGFDEGFNVVCY